MGPGWFVMRSKPCKEEFLWEQLLAHGLETYYPRIRVQPVDPRSRRIKPYFPGYLFVRADPQETKFSDLQWMPGASELVSFDNKPAFVPDALICAIKKRVDEINAADRGLPESIQPGETVTIRDGPFAGYEAIFDARADGRERVRVLLKLLQSRRMPLELSAGRIQRMDHR